MFEKVTQLNQQFKS